MSIHNPDQPSQTPSPKNGVQVIKPQQFDPNTPQTPGIQRVAAVSRQLAGSQGIWAGMAVIAPSVATGVHHHGELETVIYVVSGRGQIRWGERMEFVEDVERGDFIYVPPFVPHQEINPSPDTPSEWVVVRNAQDPIVINLEPFDTGQQAATDATHRF